MSNEKNKANDGDRNHKIPAFLLTEISRFVLSPSNKLKQVVGSKTKTSNTAQSNKPQMSRLIAQPMESTQQLEEISLPEGRHDLNDRGTGSRKDRRRSNRVTLLQGFEGKCGSENIYDEVMQDVEKIWSQDWKSRGCRADSDSSSLSSCDEVHETLDDGPLEENSCEILNRASILDSKEVPSLTRLRNNSHDRNNSSSHTEKRKLESNPCEMSEVSIRPKPQQHRQKQDNIGLNSSALTDPDPFNNRYSRTVWNSDSPKQRTDKPTLFTTTGCGGDSFKFSDQQASDNKISPIDSKTKDLTDKRTASLKLADKQPHSATDDSLMVRRRRETTALIDKLKPYMSQNIPSSRVIQVQKSASYCSGEQCTPNSKNTRSSSFDAMYSPATGDNLQQTNRNGSTGIKEQEPTSNSSLTDQLHSRSYTDESTGKVSSSQAEKFDSKLTTILKSLQQLREADRKIFQQLLYARDLLIDIHDREIQESKSETDLNLSFDARSLNSQSHTSYAVARSVSFNIQA